MKVCCSNCGNKVEKSPCYIKRNKTGLFFCDNLCRGQYGRRDYKVRCVVCDIKFEKVPAEQNRYPVHCCSVKCRSKFNNKRKNRKCDECGNKVFRPPSLLKDREHIFCSIKCHDVFQNQKTEVKCAKCEKAIWKSPCAMKKRHHFCSTKCFSKYSFSESFVETEFEKMVKPLRIPYERNDRATLQNLTDKRKSMELDFYFPTIKFAVEINGGCHYGPIYGEDALAGQKVRDKKKRRACKELGIILRVVKPGDCKRETYIPRYKRVIWEIQQSANRHKN